MTQSNSAEREKFKREVVGIYDRAAHIYDRVGIKQFSHFGRLLIDRLDISPGAHVLDVATGRGALLFLVAERVEPDGYAVGIDLAPTMVAETYAEARTRGLKQVQVIMMDADALAFRDRSFDLILCGSALHFLDYERVLVRFRQILKPHGMIATTHPYHLPGEHEQRWQWLFQLTRDVFPPDFVPPSAWVSPNRLNRPEKIEAAFGQAGFANIRISSEQALLYFADEEDWWAWEWSQGSRFWLEGMSPEGLAKFKQVSFEKLGEMKESGGIAMPVGCLFAVASA
jgi:ubiquinone/menaquinone biosynthesis C-methylase UbiE